MGKYWDNICDMQRKQTEKGIKKYGQILEDNKDLSPVERITMLQEELIDALVYAEHLKKLLKGEVKDKTLEKAQVKVCDYCYFRNLCYFTEWSWDRSEERCGFKFSLDHRTLPTTYEKAREIIDELRDAGAMI